MSLLLALETSSLKYGVAIGATREILIHRECRHDEKAFNSIGEFTASLVAEVGAKVSDISAIGLDVGPGSLSSVRAGVAYANGLAFSLGLPIVSLNSLELMASEVRQTRDLPVLCMRKAQGENVYAGFFTRHGASQLRYGRLSSLVAELVSDCREICAAGAHRATVSDVLPEVQVHDTGIDTPSVLTLYRIMTGITTGSDRELRLRSAMATPLTEAAMVFHAGR